MLTALLYIFSNNLQTNAVICHIWWEDMKSQISNIIFYNQMDSKYCLNDIEIVFIFKSITTITYEAKPTKKSRKIFPQLVNNYNSRKLLLRLR